jgi:hypothetical protein
MVAACGVAAGNQQTFISVSRVSVSHFFVSARSRFLQSDCKF